MMSFLLLVNNLLSQDSQALHNESLLKRLCKAMGARQMGEFDKGVDLPQGGSASRATMCSFSKANITTLFKYKYSWQDNHLHTIE